MHKERESSPAGPITLSIIVSLIVLGGATLLFLHYLVPLYGIELSVVHTILTRLLPVTIGLTLFFIALVVKPPFPTHSVDEHDVLDKDPLTKPLYTLPLEDETEVTRPPLFESVEYGSEEIFTTEIDSVALPSEVDPILKPFEEIEEKEEFAPLVEEKEELIEEPVEKTSFEETLQMFEEVEKIGDKEKLIEKVVEKAPFEEILVKEAVEFSVEELQELLQSLQSERIAIEYLLKNIQTEKVTMEQLLSLANKYKVEQVSPTPILESVIEEKKQVALDDTIADRLGAPLSFSAFPFEKSESIAPLLEPIGRTTVEGDLPASYLELIEDRFENRLEVELKEAIKNNYDLLLSLSSSIDEVIPLLREKLDLYGLTYFGDDEKLYSILPFYGDKSGEHLFTTLLQEIKGEYPFADLAVGFSSRFKRELTTETLVKEATLAFEIAQERGGYALISYDDELTL